MTSYYFLYTVTNLLLCCNTRLMNYYLIIKSQVYFMLNKTKKTRISCKLTITYKVGVKVQYLRNYRYNKEMFQVKIAYKKNLRKFRFSS